MNQELKSKKNLKKHYHSDTWVWNDKQIELNKLSDSQLWTIKLMLQKSKHKQWFGKTKDYWLSKINPILEHRELININKFSEDIYLRRKTKVFKFVESIICNVGKKQITKNK